MKLADSANYLNYLREKEGDNAGVQGKGEETDQAA